VWVSCSSVPTRSFFSGRAVMSTSGGQVQSDDRITSLRQWTRADPHALLLSSWLEAQGRTIHDFEGACRQICGLEGCGCVLQRSMCHLSIVAGLFPGGGSSHCVPYILVSCCGAPFSPQRTLWWSRSKRLAWLVVGVESSSWVQRIGWLDGVETEVAFRAREMLGWELVAAIQ
jgi:hypothetical protein